MLPSPAGDHQGRPYGCLLGDYEGMPFTSQSLSPTKILMSNLEIARNWSSGKIENDQPERSG